MKANSGTNKRRNNKHDKRYWDRLKEQFRTCEYDHTGAYSTGLSEKSQPMKRLQVQMEDYEQVINKLKDTVRDE